MDEGTIGIFILAALIIGFSVLCHWKIHYFWGATVLATLSATLLFQVIAYIHLGYLDPFFQIAFVVSVFWALVGALIIGYLMRRNRKQSEASNDTI